MKKSLQSKLKKYSLSAAAVLVAGTNTNAQVQYSGLVNVNVTSSYEIDLNNDQVNDFQIHVGTSSSVSFYKYAGLKAHSSNEWIQTVKNSVSYFVKPLVSNIIVGASNVWGFDSNTTNMGISWNGAYFYPDNLFIGQGEKYIGVRLNLAGGPFFGWIRVNVSAGKKSLTVVDWAYEQTSQTGILTGDGQVAIQEVSSDDLNITFGPNPTTGYLKISADDNYKVEIMDLSGKIILSAQMKSKKAEIDMSNLQAGLYIAQLSNNKITKTLKIVKD